MDEFAQSRADDDLFDDDIIPVEPSEQNTEIETATKKVEAISLESAPKGPSAGTHHSRTADRKGDRGRGRGGRGRGEDKTYGRQPSAALLQSKYAPASTQQDDGRAAAASAQALNPPDLPRLSEGEPEATTILTVNPEDQATEALVPPTEPSTPARPPAVRGDRTGTGGIKKPKLTEEELTAKLAAAKTRSESRSAAHARAEADAASFNERELAATQKRVKDAANRKVMEGEREKNRARKMAVMGGREWDAEKNEQDYKTAFAGRGRVDHTRGTNGGASIPRDDGSTDSLSQYYWHDDRGRGRGRGGRRGRGSDRGALRGKADQRNGVVRQPDISTESDFPSLPATTKLDDNRSALKSPEQKRSSSHIVSPTAGAGSWADQVEVNEAAKPERR